MARRRQSVTIKHVAADAGVSLQTVSRVINNEPNVCPEMKKRVQDSIDKLVYVPSIEAQRMSGSRSYLILAINDRERTIADWQARLGTDWVDQMLLGGMLASGERGDLGFDSGLAAARALLDLPDPPTAIIASSDQIAVATLEVARADGLSVPDNLSLISFDNTPIVRFTEPPMTALDQPIAATTAKAAELLIDGKSRTGDEEPIVMEGCLMVRGSTGRVPLRAVG